MAKEKGRTVAVTPFRRLVIDLMRCSQSNPSVTAERTFELGPLMRARQAIFPRPTWTSIFTKAYAILGREYPELRRAYLKFPWARFYEHPRTTATLNVERKVGDEQVVIFCLIKNPENRSLAEIDEIIRHHKEDPIDTVRSYQRSMRLARCPRLLRRLVWWVSLNMIGKLRTHNFGTFGITSVGGQGAGLLHLVPLLTSTLHYGMFDDDGRVNMRLSWDHRVFDGATAARILVDFEQVLLNEMVKECMGRFRAAA